MVQQVRGATLYTKFQFLPQLFDRFVHEGIALENSGKLLSMVQDPKVKRILAIELATFVEGLKPLVEVTYNLEGDGELAFEAGKLIDGIYNAYPNGALPHMPSVDRLIAEAIEFVQDNEDEQHPAVQMPAAPRTVQEVIQAVPRPRRVAAIRGVALAVQAGESDVQRNNRLAREAQAQAEAQVQYDLAVDAALAEEALLETEYLPQTTAEWLTRVRKHSYLQLQITGLKELIREGSATKLLVSIEQHACGIQPMQQRWMRRRHMHCLMS